MSSVWFDGPVQDAISLVAQRNCVFLVYIYDESEKTNTLNVTLSESHVIETIHEHAIALSFEKSSENATLFGQFYPIQTVPILYFIKQGTIRDFGIETITSDEIVEKIIQVNEMGQPPIAVVPEQTATTSPASNLPVSTPTVPVSEPVIHVPVSPAPSSAEPTETAAAPAPAPTTSTAEADEIKAKKAELQKQLETVRKERAEREKTEAKAREIKRREEAKLMQEARQNRVDQENKIYFEKIKKEKLQDEAHRKKVREQIATDRAEKMATQKRERERSSLPHHVQEVHSSSGSSSSSSSSEFSNLNIRQLNGTNLRNKFEATTTLSHVKDWISQNRTDDRKPFKLSSQFPTRAFTDEDNDTTLRDLDLCPSATIIMKPLKKSSSIALHNRVGIIKHAVTAFDIVYGFLIALIHMLTGIFTSLFTNTPPVAQQQQQQQQQQQRQQPLVRSLRGGQRLGGEPVVDQGESSSTNPTVKKRNPYATRVNTLQEEEEDDDKRSTYNGNSVNHE